MPINQELAGRSYPATEIYQVSREKVREFAVATKNTSPLHQDLAAAQQAGYTDLLAPPTFLVSLAQRAESAVVEDQEVGIDFSRVVHAEQRFTHARPVVVGDQLRAVATLESVKALGGNSMVTTRVDITEATAENADDAAPVCTVRSTLLVRA